MKKKLSITLAIIILVGVSYYTYTRFTSYKYDFSDYEPIEEFEPAYRALFAKQTDYTKNEYDIEETIRIINGLEIAQSQADDFYGFLEYMAKQDYSQVASDVIDAQLRLLPILQKMFELEKEQDGINTVWLIVQNTATNFVPLALGNPMAIASLVSDSFDAYQEVNKIKRSIKRKIDALKMEYLGYLSEFTPIYIKYMKEWDKLCLEKDKAYIDVYSGRMVDAYNTTSSILEKYPRNREALLLKALASINIPVINQMPEGKNLSTIESNLIYNDFYLEADNILDNYFELYPGRSAPALVLKGLLNQRLGKKNVALSFFDQAAIEYPRQAEYLMDLLDAYNNRTYLNKTQEGQYLLKLYRSTMEGYGMFSPNFLKAKHYTEEGMIEESKEEIFKHFFRRGNQGIYDCLLSDMQFCEDYLYSSFKRLLTEHSFLDILVEPTSDWKFTDKEDEIKVYINNRTDLNIENVRVFLCIHYTDMYKDEYDVVKVPTTKNIIKRYENTEIGTVQLAYGNKKYKDITRIRAIIMTDNKICWVDKAEYKTNLISDQLAKEQYGEKNLKSIIHSHYLKDFSLDSCRLAQTISNKLRIDRSEKNSNKVLSSINKIWSSSSDKEIKIELPRILTLINPIFSIHKLGEKDKAIIPKEKILIGESIALLFDYTPKENETFDFYIYSEYINYRIDILFKEDTYKITNISAL